MFFVHVYIWEKQSNQSCYHSGCRTTPMRGLLTAGADGAMLSLHVHVYAVSAYEVVITVVAGPAMQEYSNERPTQCCR